MVERSKLLSGFAALCTLAAGCATTGPDTPPPDAGPSACTTNCPDAGPATDAGTKKPDAGNPLCNTDGVHFSVAQVRAFLRNTCPAPLTSAVAITNAVVTGTLNYSVAHSGSIPNDGGFGSKTNFWIADAKNPQSGIWVEKFTTDYANDPSPDYLYDPQPGARVTVRGFALQRGFGTGSTNNFVSLNAAGRLGLTDQFNINRGTTALVVDVADAGQPLAALVVDAGFGNSVGGTVAANPEYAGARVYIPGPLVISNPYPVAMQGYDGYPPTGNGTFEGYELSSAGGNGPFQSILVADYAAYQRYLPDGGPASGYCDYGALQRDGGSVVFPNGVWGMWDTWSVQPCAGPVPADGGFCPNTPPEVAFINGFGQAQLAAGGNVPYLFVLWPLSCTDLPDGGL